MNRPVALSRPPALTPSRALSQSLARPEPMCLPRPLSPLADPSEAGRLPDERLPDERRLGERRLDERRPNERRLGERRLDEVLPEEAPVTEAGAGEAARIASLVEAGRLVLLRGPRGTGKSIVMRKAAFRLPRHGVPRESIFLSDLEDPCLAPGPTPQELDALMRGAARPRAVFVEGLPPGDEYIEWIRKAHRRWKAGVAVSIHGPWEKASTAGQRATGAGERASAAGQRASAAGQGAGRRSFEVIPCLPMSFGRWLDASTDAPVGPQAPQEKLEAYLRQGGLGFPESADGRRRRLTDLFHAILLKDILLRHPIRDPAVLTGVAVDLVLRTGQAVSAGQLKGRLTRSLDQARMFLSHCAESGLVCLVTRLEDAARPAAQASRLCFALDTGLANALSHGRIGWANLARTAVFHELARQGLRVHAWKARGRVGLAAGDPDRPDLLVDVQCDEADRFDLRPLSEAMARTGCLMGVVLTGRDDREGRDEPVQCPAGSGEIRVLPAWAWLARPDGSPLPARLCKPTDMPVDDKRAGRAEVRGGRTEVRGQRAEIRDGRADVRGERTEIRGGRAEIRDGRAEVRGGRTGACDDLPTHLL